MPDVFFAQERTNTCAVAALRSVLASQFGVCIPEIVLRYAGDEVERPILVHGAAQQQLRRMVEVASRAAHTGAPWGLRFHRDSSVADLAREVRAGHYPLASVWRPDCLHMVVVCGYRPGRIRYFDPDTGRTRWISVGAWRKQWHEDDSRHADRTPGAIDRRNFYAVVTGG